MFEKCAQAGISEDTLNIIKLLFSSIRLQLGNQQINFNAGTPQGSLISPILFDLYVNDLLVELGQMVTEINVKAFADDIMAICYGREQTKQVIDTVTKWAEFNSMEVNTEKSQIV